MPRSPEGQILPITPTDQLLSTAGRTSETYNAARAQFEEEQKAADSQMRKIADVLSQRLRDLKGNTSDIILESRYITAGATHRKIYKAYRPLDSTIRIVTSDRRNRSNAEFIVFDNDVSHLPGVFADFGLKISHVLSGRITGVHNKQKRA